MLKNNRVITTRQQIATLRADMTMSELRNKEYCAQRDAYKASPKGIAERKEREAIQAITNDIENKRLQAVEDLKKLRKYLVEHILRDLGIDCPNSQSIELSDEQVQAVMFKYAANINYLTENSKKLEKIAEGKNNYEYIKLYRDLIIANKAFVKVAPVSTFYYPSKLFSNNGLTVSSFVKFKDFFNEQGYFEDEMFIKANQRYFTGLKDISSITDFNELKKELRSDPSLFTGVNRTVRQTIFSSKLALAEILHSAPNVFLYMSPKEMNIAGDMSSSLVGKIIARNPEVLDNLPANFFDVNKPKFVFNELTKAQIHELAKDYYSTYPELKRYMEKYVKGLEKAKVQADVQSNQDTDDLSI